MAENKTKPTGASAEAYLDAPRREELLARLGRHKLGKACLYLRKLSEIDLETLEQLVAGSIAGVQRRYGSRTEPARRTKPEARGNRSRATTKGPGRPARRSD